jgi:hypothetical protein
MGKPSRFSRRTRKAQIDILEGRELLSVRGLHALLSAEVAPLDRGARGTVTIRGTVSGVSDATALAADQGQESLSGGGYAVARGPVTFSCRINTSTKSPSKSVTVTSSPGASFTLSSSVSQDRTDSNQIFVSFKGSGRRDGQSISTIPVHGAVTGGSGGYGGVSGTFNGRLKTYYATDTFSLSFTMKLRGLD